MYFPDIIVPSTMPHDAQFNAAMAFGRIRGYGLAGPPWDLHPLQTMTAHRLGGKQPEIHHDSYAVSLRTGSCQVPFHSGYRTRFLIILQRSLGQLQGGTTGDISSCPLSHTGIWELMLTQEMLCCRFHDRPMGSMPWLEGQLPSHDYRAEKGISMS